jgi:hypothetical protein
MRNKRNKKSNKVGSLIAVSFFSLLTMLAAATPSLAVTYNVKLANGNTIQANSYRVDKGQVFLGYPVGEGAFPLSRVTSITAEGGSANLLQSQGESKPAENKAAPAEKQKPELPFDPVAFKKNVREHLKAAREASNEGKAANGTGGAGGNSPAQKPFVGNPDPEQDALIDQLSNTDDEAKQDAIEKQLFDDTNMPEAKSQAQPKTKVPVAVPKSRN